MKSLRLQAHITGLLAAFAMVAGARAADDPSPYTIDLHAAASHPAGVPIILTVTQTNITDKPRLYVPSVRYPAAKGFVARITDDQGKTRDERMSNDEDGAISGPGFWIKAGASIDFPAMIGPLPVGSYKIQVGKGKSARVTVKDDRELTRKWERDLLTNIRKRDLFARYVACKCLAAKHPSKALIDDLLQDLLSDDEKVAEWAAWPLFFLRELPPNAITIISKAIPKHLALIKQRRSVNTATLPYLAHLASMIGTDEALEAVLSLARTEIGRGAAILALGNFKQEKAVKQLRFFLQDENDEVQFRAAQLLADRKDPDAIEVLLAVAHDPKSRWRMYSFKALLNYRGDPRVEPAIKSGLDDPDSSVRSSAEFALRTLRSAKKP